MEPIVFYIEHAQKEAAIQFEEHVIILIINLVVKKNFAILLKINNA